jgi:glutamyl-tRNA synthetase
MSSVAGITRLAPSPTGPLHLGHACSFLAAWLLARRNGWRVLLRLDDLDAARVQAGGPDPLETLDWLGLGWDGEPIRQSTRLDLYRQAMRRLASAGRVFESPQSRQEVREAAESVGAPHEGAGHVVFPTSLRPPPGKAWAFRDPSVNHRLRVEPGWVHVQDELAGPHAFEPASQHGDFLVWTKAGVPSYQLACAVDDAELGVTDVVRGADLLESAALQSTLLGALGHAPPRWWHLPLVRDAKGRRLAKRDGADSLQSLRAAGVPSNRVVGLAGWWLGVCPLEPAEPSALVAGATSEAMRRAASRWPTDGGPRVDSAVVAWLHGGSVAPDTLDLHAGGGFDQSTAARDAGGGGGSPAPSKPGAGHRQHP